MESEENTGEGFVPTPLADVFSGPTAPREKEPAGRPEPAPAPPAEAATGEKPEAEDGPARDERGRFAPKAEEAEQPKQADEANAAPPAAKSQPQTVPIAAVLEERRKRQDLEQRLRDMEARFAAPQPQAQSQPAAPEVPIGDLLFQDPERALQVLEERANARAWNQMDRAARMQPDYDDATNALAEFVDANPGVRAQVSAALREHGPWWGLEQGRALLQQRQIQQRHAQWASVIDQYGSPEAYAEYLRQQAPAQPAPSRPSPTAPPGSLASVRSAGPRTGPTWSGPTPSSAIWGR